MRRPFRDAVDATVASMAYERYQTLRPNAAVAMLARTHTYTPGTDKTRVRPLARHRRDAIQPTQAHLVKLKKGQVNVLRNKVRFILAVLSEELVVHNRKKAELLAQLVEDGYDAVIPESCKKPKTAAAADDDASDDEEAPKQIEEPDDLRTLAKGYDYLLSMRLWALTRERVDALRAELSEKDAELRTLMATATTDLWLTDLQALEEQLDIDDAKREAGEARRLRLRTSRRAIDATPCARRPTRRRKPRHTLIRRARRYVARRPRGSVRRRARRDSRSRRPSRSERPRRRRPTTRTRRAIIMTTTARCVPVSYRARATTAPDGLPRRTTGARSKRRRLRLLRRR